MHVVLQLDTLPWVTVECEYWQDGTVIIRRGSQMKTMYESRAAVPLVSYPPNKMGATRFGNNQHPLRSGNWFVSLTARSILVGIHRCLHYLLCCLQCALLVNLLVVLMMPRHSQSPQKLTWRTL